MAGEPLSPDQQIVLTPTSLEFARSNLPAGCRLVENPTRDWARHLPLDLVLSDERAFPSDGLVVCNYNPRWTWLPKGWIESYFAPLALHPVHLWSWATATDSKIAAAFNDDDHDPCEPAPWPSV